MNAPLLTLIVTTLLLIAPVADGGSTSGKFSLSGAWAGYNAPGGPGSTGGEFFLTLEGDGKAAAPRTPVTGLIQVPDLREGTFEFKPITGTVSAKGVIRAKFQGGTVRGRLNRGGHDARGSVYLNTHRYWALGFWFADDSFTTPPTSD